MNLGAAGAYRAHGSARMSAFYAAKAGIVRSRRRSRGRSAGADVANAVLFLVSEEAEFATGDVLGVAGGWLL
ncbi:MAG TPA: hypothetical protein VF992_03045 [Thermoplasmata archaeon]